jgi:membrane associated rhomboid family serine protease
MNQQELRYRLFKSSVAKIFFMAISFYSFVMIIKIYFLLNDYKAAWFVDAFYPYLTVNNGVLPTLKHVWVLLTHFFFEDNFFALLGNISWLFFFGLLLEEIRGEYSLVTFYILSGLATGIVVMSIATINPAYLPYKFYFGMQAPIAAIATAAIATNPKRRIFEQINGGLPIYAFGGFYIALQILKSYKAGIAPFAALLVALAIGFWYYKGLDILIYRLQDEIEKWIKGDKKPEVKRENPYAVVEVTQEKIDELLDKINTTGMESLTAQERKWLENFNR